MGRLNGSLLLREVTSLWAVVVEHMAAGGPKNCIFPQSLA